MLDLTHIGGYHVLLFANRPYPAAAVEQLVERLADRYVAMVATHVIPPSETAAYRAYYVAGTRLVLIRPDGHIAAVADPFEPDAVWSMIDYLDEVPLRAQ